MTEDVHALPYITIQHDLHAVEADVQDGSRPESCWISCYPATEGGEGVHGKLLIDRDEDDELRYTAQDGVEVEQVTTTELIVGCSSLGIPPTRIKRPKQTMTHLHANGVTACAVGPGSSSSIATGGADGSLRFSEWSGPKASTSIEPKGVIGDVNDIEYFPSGEVVLVSSTDMRIRVYGLQGSNPRTLASHTRSVEAALPLPPKGRLVLSASRDGTAKLWRVADASCLHTFRLSSTANALAIGRRPPGFEGGVRRPDGDEAVDAASEEDLEEGLLAFIGLSDGSTSILDLSSRSILSSLPGTSAALTVAYDETNGLITTGHNNGIVTIHRLDGSLFTRWRRGTNAAVHSVLFSRVEGRWPTVLVAGEDGLPYRVALRGGEGDEGVKVEVVEEYMGIDTDSVEVLREARGGVFAASKDGCVRRW